MQSTENRGWDHKISTRTYKNSLSTGVQKPVGRSQPHSVSLITLFCLENHSSQWRIMIIPWYYQDKACPAPFSIHGCDQTHSLRMSKQNEYSKIHFWDKFLRANMKQPCKHNSAPTLHKPFDSVFVTSNGEGGICDCFLEVLSEPGTWHHLPRTCVNLKVSARQIAATAATEEDVLHQLAGVHWNLSKQEESEMCCMRFLLVRAFSARNDTWDEVLHFSFEKSSWHSTAHAFDNRGRVTSCKLTAQR